MIVDKLRFYENAQSHFELSGEYIESSHASHQADISCLDIKHALQQAERSKTDISQDEGQLFSFILSNL